MSLIVNIAKTICFQLESGHTAMFRPFKILKEQITILLSQYIYYCDEIRRYLRYVIVPANHIFTVMVDYIKMYSYFKTSVSVYKIAQHKHNACPNVVKKHN